jgi:hypothetical protein
MYLSDRSAAQIPEQARCAYQPIGVSEQGQDDVILNIVRSRSDSVGSRGRLPTGELVGDERLYVLASRLLQLEGAHQVGYAGVESAGM